jgi:hypothetical protein
VRRLGSSAVSMAAALALLLGAAGCGLETRVCHGQDCAGQVDASSAACSSASPDWQSCDFAWKDYGKYTVINNMWASSSGSCMWATSERCWGSSAQYENGEGTVKAYASAYRGDHYGSFGTVNPTNGLPAKIADLSQLSARWNMSTPKDGRYMVLWDIYFREDAATSGDYHADLMLFQYWFDRSGAIGTTSDVEGQGDYVGRFTVGGHTWRVRHIASDSRVTGGPVIVGYVDPIVEDATIDLKQIIDWAVGQGWLSQDWFLSVIEVGWQLIETGPPHGDGQFQTNDFQVSINDEPAL